jgi:hypothetical protein
MDESGNSTFELDDGGTASLPRQGDGVPMGLRQPCGQPEEVPQHLRPATGKRAHHLGWSFKGRARFEAAASTFVAQGAGRGDRVMLVMEDPSPRQWPRRLIDEGILQLVSSSEVYGTRNVIEPGAMWDAFTASLVEARELGFSGLTVVSDNTAQLTGSEQVAAWTAWEEAAERFISENSVTAICGFDRERLDRDVVDRLMGLHHVTLIGR